MRFGSPQLWLKVILAGALAFGETSAFALNQCAQDLVDRCRANASSVMSAVGEQSYTSGNSKQDIQRTGEANRWGGARMGKESANCQDSASECKKCAKGNQKEEKACEEAVAAQANDMKQQSQSMSSGGGDMGAIAGLLGAAAGMAMAMMNKKDKQQPPPQPVATGALQLNGALNCNMQDSYRYEDCAGFLTNYCSASAAQAASGTTAATPATGTVISMPGGALPPTPDCASFNANYCSSNVTPPQPYGMMRTDGAVTQVNMAGTGGGIGTPYCSRTVATNWCSENPARAMCPSCRQADAYASQTCATNPALCPAVTSPQQVAMATDNAACAGDPLYTPGSPFAVAGTPAAGASNSSIGLAAGVNAVGAAGFPAGGTGGVPTATVPTTTVGANGLPVAILPSSTSSMQTASAQLGGREGRAPGGGKPSSGSSSASLSGITLKTSSAHAHASANELIAAGGVIVANGAAASRGPASDVQSKFSPSLFTTSSAVIRQHCEAGKLKNCP